MDFATVIARLERARARLVEKGFPECRLAISISADEYVNVGRIVATVHRRSMIRDEALNRTFNDVADAVVAIENVVDATWSPDDIDATLGIVRAPARVAAE